MRVFSTFSGISAASVAWRPLGYRFVGFSEIEPLPCHVLHHRCGASQPRRLPIGDVKRAKAVAGLPEAGIPNLGDISQITDEDLQALGPVDVLEGGTPCQDFSVAGLRKGLAGARGNLTLAFCDLAERMRRVNNLQFIVWENVYGVLSDKTNGFGNLLAALVGESRALVAPGQRWTNAGHVAGPEGEVAWRVFDAQYWGVPQRRRRVFAVASVGDRQIDPRAILFEPKILRRHSEASGNLGKGAPSGSDRDTIVGPLAYALCDDYVPKASPDLAYSLLAGSATGTGHTPCVVHRQAIANTANPENRAVGIDAPSIVAAIPPSAECDSSLPPSVTPPVMRAPANGASRRCRGGTRSTASGRQRQRRPRDRRQAGVASAEAPWIVRRLLPVECERLQGFPDGWTGVPFRGRRAADTPRYRAIGNSMAVPCMRFIGERLLECWLSEGHGPRGVV
ncbi:DNA cytosine methyltransferase [Mesorhizobium sp. AR07]|uniref:DNA cytosine methyltransferase n=1 Tax=Mesorhizobium sp. AR07 TaxID=2865838 RepID=UPI00215F63A9|nr:DNA cytosine methyltransferase [Mesorhizobium sp. AR07]UVK44389.1 DNA cytosine methyltransferase [Mesorhizobium sp. AR07]